MSESTAVQPAVMTERLTDAQIKEIAEAQDSWGVCYGWTPESDFNKPFIPAHAYTFARAIEAAIASRQGERELMERDAARYRWLRDKAVYYHPDQPSAWCVIGKGYRDARPVQRCELDEAIDAALSPEATKEQP